LFTTPQFNFTEKATFNPKIFDQNPQLIFNDEPITISPEELLEYSDKISEILPNSKINDLFNKIMKNQTELDKLKNIKEDEYFSQNILNLFDKYQDQIQNQKWEPSEQ